MSTARLPTYFLSHGGGPWPWLKQEMGKTYDVLEDSLKRLPADIGVTPKAILMVSAHWESRDFAVMSHPHPPMVYDYSGFPEHTYQIKYAAPGDPVLAKRVAELIKGAGLESRLDDQRGFDHGTYSVLQSAYPNADVPVVQLSILRNFAPLIHVAVGRALAPLRDEGVVIIGSGLSYHNLRRFDASAREVSKEWDDWLRTTLLAADPKERVERLDRWSKAPSARVAHPREDHLLPLMVAVGAAEQEKGARIYYENTFMGGITVSSYRFG